jgi:VWFA-related protein
MVRVNGSNASHGSLGMASTVLAILLAFGIPALHAQSGTTQNPQPPATSQPAQEIPDAPSAVQPPAPKLPPARPDTTKKPDEIPFPGDAPQQQPNQQSDQSSSDQDKQAPPSMPPVETLPAGSAPRNQISKEDIYTVYKAVNFVQIPVMVKTSDGRPVDGLSPRDFTVLENGKKQSLTFFTSDPFQLSVAVVLDIGMADVAVQKVNQTYSSLVGAFSPYDEVALYTYSSTVSQVTDFSGNSNKLTAVLNEMKLVRGHNNGPPVLNGPLASGPTVNGAPVGGPIIQPVNTPPREAHVLNDAILRAALDLSKREKTRRKIIFVISDGRELGSKASYGDVLRLLETRDIQVKAVVVDAGALPVYRQLDKLHLKGQGYSNVLPRYTNATGGGQPFSELSRNAMEDAYAQITSEARNQYTLGYAPKPLAGNTSAYRTIEVLVDRKGLKVSAKDGFYSAR